LFASVRFFPQLLQSQQLPMSSYRAHDTSKRDSIQKAHVTHRFTNRSWNCGDWPEQQTKETV